ncbi:MAG: 30S ribosome-binding factor RbfA [Candidatus Coatesbacteria bacterium]|nr:30S ribosome-binding factor RbfA [Candidatus Coatesbacteria bacterium]
MHAFNRSDRIEHEIQKEVCSLLQRRVKDPRIGYITITTVKVTHDLGHARILYTLPALMEEHSEDVKKGLISATGFIRTELGKRLRLRKVPEIEFLKDELYEKALSVADTIARLEKDKIPEDE